MRGMKQLDYLDVLGVMNKEAFRRVQEGDWKLT